MAVSTSILCVLRGAGLYNAFTNSIYETLNYIGPSVQTSIHAIFKGLVQHLAVQHQVMSAQK